MSEVPIPPHRRRAHTSTRDLERYAGLFAERTTVMRSSAMRDLMAITARPEVISLAGGLPDTSTFPPKSFAAQMTRIAQSSSAQALQYGPTEGFERTKRCIAEVMAAEGMNPEIEDIFTTSHTTTDEAARMDMWARVQEILAEDVPQAVIAQPSFNLPVRSTVSGWVQPVDGLFRLQYLETE